MKKIKLFVGFKRFFVDIVWICYFIIFYMFYIYDNWYWIVCLMVVIEILIIFVYKCLLNDLYDLVWEIYFVVEMVFIELWE